MGDRYDNNDLRTVFVGKLDYGAEEEDLSTVFERYGVIEKSKLKFVFFGCRGVYVY